MADNDTKPAPAPIAKQAAAAVAAPTPVLTPDARVIEQQQFNRKLAADDAARAKAENVTMVAIASFTMMVDDPEHPEGKVINAGQEFEISAFDVPRYLGRAHRKELDNPNPAGVTSNRP